MTRKQELKSKGGRASYYIVALLTIVSLGVFFGAPVVPVDMSLSEYSSHCGAYQYNFTDWQSTGYHLVGIGYHFTTPRSLGCI